MTGLPLRVLVLDSWDEIPLALDPATPVAQVKAQALQAARVRGTPDDYVVKFRGALVPEGSTTLQDAGVVPNANLIVLRHRRRPVR